MVLRLLRIFVLTLTWVPLLAVTTGGGGGGDGGVCTHVHSTMSGTPQGSVCMGTGSSAACADEDWSCCCSSCQLEKYK